MPKKIEGIKDFPTKPCVMRALGVQSFSLKCSRTFFNVFITFLLFIWTNPFSIGTFAKRMCTPTELAGEYGAAVSKVSDGTVMCVPFSLIFCGLHLRCPDRCHRPPTFDRCRRHPGTDLGFATSAKSSPIVRTWIPGYLCQLKAYRRGEIDFFLF